MLRHGFCGGAWAVLALLVAGGCEAPPELASTSNDGVSAIQFDDIPVPAGLELQERYHRSDSRKLGEYRYGNFVYAGRVPIPEVSDYMRERMPQHAWLLTAREQGPGDGETLRFRRGKYVAECRLRTVPQTGTEMNVSVRTTVERDDEK